MSYIYSRSSSLGSRGSVGETGRLKPALESVRATPGGERGQALIEFAFVLPIILVFILVIVDFGIAVDRRQVLQHAVRDGVRFGAVGNTVAQVEKHVRDQSVNVLVPADKVEVCYLDEDDPGTNAGNAGDSIKVTAYHTYKFSIGGGEMLGWFGIDASLFDIPMDPSATLRLEASVSPAPTCAPTPTPAP